MAELSDIGAPFGAAGMDSPCQATAAGNPPTPMGQAQRLARAHLETSDTYTGLVARLCDRWRVVTCRDQLQWILQRRDAQRSGQPRWKGVGYFRTREALIRVSRALCERIDPAAMAILLALPDRIGGGS